MRYMYEAACVLAVLNHAYLRKYESRGVATPLAVLLVEPMALLAALRIPTSATSISLIYGIFFFTLGASIISYRLSPFHPLAKFPGPTMYKATKLWGAWTCWQGHQQRAMKRMHDIYGPVVRTGPNELSIIDPDAIAPVLGVGGLPKDTYYRPRQDPSGPGRLLVLTGKAHTDRRRLWNRGMTKHALAEYQTPISTRGEQLVERLKGLSGPVDLVKWLNYLMFDTMGDISFGGGFGMLSSGDDDGLWHKMDGFAAALAVICHIPWSCYLFQNFPFVSRHLKSFPKFGASVASNRVQAGSQTKDLWYHLTDEAGLEKEKPPLQNVIADGGLAVVVGSDTTSAGMSSLFYFLLSNEECYKRVQEEVDRVFPDGEPPFNTSKHSDMPFLTACINETLRLLPPAPTSGPREVPKGCGGKMIAGLFVPEGTQIYIPPYAMHRNPEHFSPSPNEFIPSRWLEQDTTKETKSGFRSQSAYVLNKNAFIPFSYGPANCVGKALALQEMMTIVSLLMQKFELRFAEGFDHEGWQGRLLDYMVTVRSPLLVELIVRD